MPLQLQHLSIPEYEQVIKVRDASVGLFAIIALHDTTLGPALGGTRIFPYRNAQDALQDVLRLARGMTYKSAIAETGLGGGKSVIIADLSEKTPALLEAFGQAVDTLGGKYIAAEDVNCSIEDVMAMSSATPYVTGICRTWRQWGSLSFYGLGNISRRALRHRAALRLALARGKNCCHSGSGKCWGKISAISLLGRGDVTLSGY